MPWRVYYDDGTTIDSDEATPEQVRPFGVLIIAQKVDGQPRNLMSQWDWYYWHEEDGQWWGCDLHGLLDRLLHRLPVRAVVMGRTVSTKQFNELMTLADKNHLDWLK